MLGPRNFMRMALWLRRPPSMTRVKMVFGIVLICAAIFAIERYIGWPDALTAEKLRLRP